MTWLRHTVESLILKRVSINAFKTLKVCFIKIINFNCNNLIFEANELSIIGALELHNNSQQTNMLIPLSFPPQIVVEIVEF